LEGGRRLRTCSRISVSRAVLTCWKALSKTSSGVAKMVERDGDGREPTEAEPAAIPA